MYTFTFRNYCYNISVNILHLTIVRNNTMARWTALIVDGQLQGCCSLFSASFSRQTFKQRSVNRSGLPDRAVAYWEGDREGSSWWGRLVWGALLGYHHWKGPLLSSHSPQITSCHYLNGGCHYLSCHKLKIHPQPIWGGGWSTIWGRGEVHPFVQPRSQDWWHYWMQQHPQTVHLFLWMSFSRCYRTASWALLHPNLERVQNWNACQCSGSFSRPGVPCKRSAAGFLHNNFHAWKPLRVCACQLKWLDVLRVVF